METSAPIQVIKSEQDTDREYRYIILPNKLHALLIHEKDTEKVLHPYAWCVE